MFKELKSHERILNERISVIGNNTKIFRPKFKIHVFEWHNPILYVIQIHLKFRHKYFLSESQKVTFSQLLGFYLCELLWVSPPTVKSHWSSFCSTLTWHALIGCDFIPLLREKKVISWCWRLQDTMTEGVIMFRVLTHSSVTLRGIPLGKTYRCLLLQRTMDSRQVHSVGHWTGGVQLASSWSAHIRETETMNHHAVIQSKT